MSTIALAGNACTKVRANLPPSGIWTAPEVVLAKPIAIDVGALVDLTIGDLTLSGHVYRGETFVGGASYYVVGGKGGWRRVIPAKAYSDTTPVRLSKILTDAAAAPASLKPPGRAETLSLDQALDRPVGLTWTRDGGDAAMSLRRLVRGPWWVDAAGVTQVRARPTGSVQGRHDVGKYDPSRRILPVATDSPAAWEIGRTFTAATLASAITVREVWIEATAGALRLEVYG